MKRLHQDSSPAWFDRHPTIAEVEIDPFSGKELSPSVRPRLSSREIVHLSSRPQPANWTDYDETGRLKLPEIYDPWLKSSSASLRRQLTIDRSMEKRDFEITSPLPGMVIYLDPDLLEGGRILRLTTNLASEATWFSDTLEIDPKEPVARLRLGEHQITAEDPETGQQQTVSFSVEQS